MLGLFLCTACASAITRTPVNTPSVPSSVLSPDEELADYKSTHYSCGEIAIQEYGFVDPLCDGGWDYYRYGFDVHTYFDPHCYCDEFAQAPCITWNETANSRTCTAYNYSWIPEPHRQLAFVIKSQTGYKNETKQSTQKSSSTTAGNNECLVQAHG